MARGTGTNRALSEANISELIRGNPAALAAQAAKGGNTKPTPGATPTPAAQPAGATPNPANPTQPPTGMPPVPTAAQAAANAAASAAGVQASNNPNAPQSMEGDDSAADVDSPAEAKTEEKKDEKDKKEEEKTIQYRDSGGRGPQFLFGMAGRGDINEGPDTAATAEQQKSLLKRLVKKLGTPQPPPGSPLPPTK